MFMAIQLLKSNFGSNVIYCFLGFNLDCVSYVYIIGICRWWVSYGDITWRCDMEISYGDVIYDTRSLIWMSF